MVSMARTCFEAATEETGSWPNNGETMNGLIRWPMADLPQALHAAADFYLRTKVLHLKMI